MLVYSEPLEEQSGLLPAEARGDSTDESEFDSADDIRDGLGLKIWMLRGDVGSGRSTVE